MRFALFTIVWWGGWAIAKYFELSTGYAYGTGFVIALVYEAYDRQLRTASR